MSCKTLAENRRAFTFSISIRVSTRETFLDRKRGIPSRYFYFPSSICHRNISQHVQVLAALALAVVQAHLVENFPSEVQVQNGFAIVQFRQ